MLDAEASDGASDGAYEPLSDTLGGMRFSMSPPLSLSVAATLFGSQAPTLLGYIEEALGPAVGDYDVSGLEDDLRALIDETLPAGVTLVGQALMVDDAAHVTEEDVRDAVGWLDVHTVAVGHDMAGPGA